MKHTKGQSMPDGTIQYYKDVMGRAMVSTDYDPTSSYAVGDYCIYDNVRYICNTAIASGGETWNSAHWDVAKVDDDISAIKSSLSDLEDIVEQMDGLTIYKQITNVDIASFVSNNSMPIMKLLTNISNVSGCTEANVTVCGKNLWGGEKFADDIIAKVPNATKDTINHTVTYSASNIGEKILFTNFKENTQYSIFIDLVSGTRTNLRVVYKDGTSQGIAGTIYPFITEANKSVDYIIGIWAGGSTTINYLTSGLFEGEITAQDFESYNGHTYNIPFVDSGGNTLTIYNGSVDLISGILIDDDNTTTYQLSANPINDLQGDNNIWSDTGSIANIGYLDILNIT